MDSVSIKVHLVPFQPQDFTPTGPGDKQQVNQCFPFDRLPLQRFTDSGHLFGLEVVDLLLLDFGQRGLAGHVEGDKALLLCLVQHCGDQPMVFNDGFWGQCTDVLL